MFDIDLLADRLAAATDWLRTQPDVGGAADRLLRGEHRRRGRAVGAPPSRTPTSRPWSPAAAGPTWPARASPTSRRRRCSSSAATTRSVLDLNRQAQAQLRCENRLAVVPGATHLFEEPGALDAVADLATAGSSATSLPAAHAAWTTKSRRSASELTLRTSPPIT